MRHLKLKKIQLPVYQKIAIGTWSDPMDPSIYGYFDVDYEKTQALADKIFQEKGLKISPLYFSTQVCALVYTCNPKLNVVLRGNSLYQRDSLTISLLVAMDPSKNPEGRSDLSSCNIDNAGERSVIDNYECAQEQISGTRTGKSDVSRKQQQLFKKLSPRMSAWLLNFISYMMYTLNIKLPGMPRNPFGSIMISNVGQMGADQAFIPLVKYSRAPTCIGLGQMKPRPWVTEDRQLVVRDALRFNVTMDHRYIEGKSLSVMYRMIHFVFKDPERWLMRPPLEIKEEFKEAFYAQK